MPPSKKPEQLTGRTVLAPRSLWPEYPLPKGKTGFEGKVGKKKGPKQHYVLFPGDTNRYFFDDKEIRKWLVVDGPSGSTKAAAPATSGRATAETQKPAASKRKEEGGPSSAAAAQVPATEQAEQQPSKKAKAVPEAAVPKPSSVKASGKQSAKEAEVASVQEKEESPSKLRSAIMERLEVLTHQGLQDVYAACLKASKQS